MQHHSQLVSILKRLFIFIVVSDVKEVINPYDTSPGGAKKKYDISSGFYHFIMGVWEIKPNEEAIQLAELKRGEIVLDVAFGTGWCLQRIIRKVGAPVHGVDFSSGMCKVCKGNLKRKGIWHLSNIIQGDALYLPFKDKIFDVVFSTFLLDLLPLHQIQQALSEMKRVLKEDGRIVAMTLTKEGEGIKKAARRLYEWFYDKWPIIGGYRASSRPIYLQKEVERAKLTVIKGELTHIPLFQFPVKIVAAKQNP